MTKFQYSRESQWEVMNIDALTGRLGLILMASRPKHARLVEFHKIQALQICVQLRPHSYDAFGGSKGQSKHATRAWQLG